MAIARMNKRGPVTIPAAVRNAANLREGDPLHIEVTSEGVLMRSAPKRDPGQWWFWEKEWHDGELEIDARRAANPVSSTMDDRGAVPRVVGFLGR